MSFTRICTLNELPEEQIVCLQADGQDLVLIRKGEQVFALENQCSHAEVSFEEGELSGNQLICPMHGAAFNIASGEALRMPATEAIEVFPARINGNDVEVDLD